MELQDFQEHNPNPHTMLLEYLKDRQYERFEILARRGINRSPPNIDINHVFPHPEDKTVLDIASSEGLEDFVKLIMELGANPNKENVAHQRSPLHFAAEAGNAIVLEILLSHPAIKPNLEVARQTALHLAVSNKNIECVEVLLDHNASPNIANSKGLTPTHMAALTAQEDVINLIFSRSKLPPDIDSFKDFTKRTTRQVLEQKLPHVQLPPVRRRATDISNLKYYLDCNDEKSYLAHAEHVKITTEEISDLLEISVKHDLPEVVKSLVHHENGIEEKVLAKFADIAAEKGHHRVLRELFDAGAERSGSLLIKACQQLGSRAARRSNRMECVRLILLKKVDVRCADANGNTALHYAAMAGSSEIISKLLKAGSYIGHENTLGITPVADITPESMSRHFDDCLQISEGRTEKLEDVEIEFNFQCLRPHDIIKDRKEKSLLEKGSVNSINICMEMQPILYIANSNSHQHLLKHPLLSSFLDLKWQRVRPILNVNVIFYVIVYLLLNAYIFSMIPTSKNDSNANAPIPSFAVGQQGSALWLSTATALAILLLREILQLVSSPRKYLLNFENWFELLLVLLGIALLRDSRPSIGAVVILLSAWKLIILIGRYSRMSTAIEMFKTVTRNFMHFLSLYALLILAFSFAFYTLFKDGKDKSFMHLGYSVFTTIVMVSGEFNAENMSFQDHPVLSHFVFVLFVFLIAIILFNLMNGLAVSDIAKISAKAELVGLISRTKYVAYLESVIVGSPTFKKLWCRNYEKLVQRFSINPLRFLAKKILIFSNSSPDTEFKIKAMQCNGVIVSDATKTTNRWFKLKLDHCIMSQAKEIISARGHASEYDKIVDILNQKFGRLETYLLNSMRSSDTKSSNYTTL